MKLIVVDPNVTSKSPSMRGWLEAFPHFRSLFEHVEIWASECELEEDGDISWVRIPKRFPMWALHAMDFQYHVRSAMRHMPLSDHTILQVTGCTTRLADIRYMHYWNCALLEERAKRPKDLKLNAHQRLSCEWAAATERKVAASTDATKWWWVVSRSICDRIARQSKGGNFRILPNQYDPSRFNHQTRELWREEIRRDYGISPNESILAFSAFGHFERKGLIQAVEAISILRKHGHPIRLMVIGGTPSTLSKFRQKLQKQGLDTEGCIFTGLVSQMERHLSAADGFFFPSHFEAFSLAEIESAALGLRLYLTDHYGTEMILREPVNGRCLPWEPSGMADVILDDITKGILGRPHNETGDAITPEQYRSRIISLYEEAIADKKSHSKTLV